MLSVGGAAARLLASCCTGARNLIGISHSSTLVPSSPSWREIKRQDLPPPRKLDAEEVEYLESVSLVQYRNTAVEKAKLEDTIRLADTLHLVDTADVEPMTLIFEDECLRLRPDVITEEGSAKEILKNAKVTEEGYFVAPPGNVAFLDTNKKSISNDKDRG